MGRDAFFFPVLPYASQTSQTNLGNYFFKILS